MATKRDWWLGFSRAIGTARFWVVFGRDSLYTTYAINSYGDFALTRTELEFLIARQRADGKMPARILADGRCG